MLGTIAMPSSLVVTVGSVVPLSTDLTVTLAPGTTAPEGSVAFTVTCPVSVCDRAEAGLENSNSKTATKVVTPCICFFRLLFIRTSWWDSSLHLRQSRPSTNEDCRAGKQDAGQTTVTELTSA